MQDTIDLEYAAGDHGPVSLLARQIEKYGRNFVSITQEMIMESDNTPTPETPVSNVLPFVAKKYLSAQDIIAVQDIVVIDVEVPDWNGTVKMRSLSTDEAVDFTDMLSDETKKKQAQSRLLVKCLVDETGAPLFTEAAVASLQKKSLRAMNLLQDAAMKLNGLDKKDGKAAAKNV